MKRILIILLALLLVLPSGSTYRRVTWYDWFYNLPFRQWYWPLQLSRYDPGFGFCVWVNRSDTWRHEDMVLFVRYGLAMDSRGNVLAYDPSAHYGAYVPDPVTDTPPLLDPAVLQLDFSTADMIDLGAYGPLTNMSQVGTISFIFEFILTYGRMLLVYAERLPEVFHIESPDPWKYYSITNVDVLDFFAETREEIYCRPGYSFYTYPHISQKPNGYAHYDLARAKKLAQQETTS